jgi:quercetin dioxygenase-like cupin family protein
VARADLIPVSELPGTETASRFEGKDYGSSVSFFLSRHPKGKGAPLHRHPYDETFIVEAGSARFTVDGEEMEVGAGNVVVVPAGAAHGFVSSGAEPLRQVSIHPSSTFVQEWLEQ